MFGWLNAEASVASLMNISTRSGRPASCGSIVLMTIRFSKPRTPLSLARQTSAIPPVASFESISYRLKCVPACQSEVRPRVSGSPAVVEPVTLVDVVIRTPWKRRSFAITSPRREEINGAPPKNLTGASRKAGQLAFRPTRDGQARVCLGVGQPAFCPTVSSLRALFSTEIFMPRGHDYFWTPKLLVLEGVSNLVLALACFVLAVAFLRRRAGRAAPSGRTWTVLALGTGLAAVTHLFDVWLIWAPLYWLDVLVRCAAALAGLAAAVTLLNDRGDRGDR